MGKSWLAIAFLFIFTGCADDNYDQSFDYRTDLGIRVRIDHGAFPPDSVYIDDYYREMSLCVFGEYVPPDFLIVMSRDAIISEGEMAEGTAEFPSRGTPIITVWAGDQRYYEYTLAVISHEIVHVLLRQDGKYGHGFNEFECAYL